jgi:transcriptional regulator with XRE-family HTH domain
MTKINTLTPIDPLLALGQHIRRARKTYRLTQRQLAEMSSVTQRTITLLERGQGNPTVGTLQKLAHVFGSQVSFQLQHRPILYNNDKRKD